MGANTDILPSNSAEQLVDFTCASPWERLALDIELEFRAWAIHDGKSPASDIPTSPRHTTSLATATASITPTPVVCSRLFLGKLNLSLELRSAPPSESFSPHTLERLFGVTEYVLLTSAVPDGIVADEAPDAAILLSAMSVAASSCDCALPMFVPVGRPSTSRFIGRQLFPRLMRFSGDYTHQPSGPHQNIAGLLSLFRNKRASARRHVPLRSTNVQIAARFSYDWTDFSFKLAPTPGTFASDRRLAAVQARALTEADPIRCIQISALWNRFSASELKQNDLLIAMLAATASCLRLCPASDLSSNIATASFPSSRIPMATCAKQNLRLAFRAASELGNANPAAPIPLIDMHEVVRPHSVRSRNDTTRHLSSDSPRAATASSLALEDYLLHVGKYVEDAGHRDESVDEEFLTSAIAALFEMDLGHGIMDDVVDALGPNAAESGVLERVARLIAVSESLDAAQRLWNLFLDGVQVHWEQLWVVGGVAFGIDEGPDHDASLVMQKLQMINCCVERLRKERSRRIVTTEVELDGDGATGIGRKCVLPGVGLIGHSEGEKSNDDVWEPFVQPHPLVTRDMVEDELQRMVLRAEANGGEKSDDMEARRQSLTLKSDMMAFKAANPNACLADFVRWFSPSDWVIDEDDVVNAGTPSVGSSDPLVIDSDCDNVQLHKLQKQAPQGRLSARMSREGNIWEELWKAAESMPAYQQVPLFDAAAHGNKVLADLRAMPLAQVFAHMAIIQSDCACTLLQRAYGRPPELPRVHKIAERARQAVRRASTKIGLTIQNEANLAVVKEMVDKVSAAEHAALVATSVLTKLPPADGMGAVVDKLAIGEFVDVVAEKERQLIIRMAGLDDGGWRNVLLPKGREFIITNDDDDGDRMFAKRGENEFRVGFCLSLNYDI